MSMDSATIHLVLVSLCFLCYYLVSIDKGHHLHSRATLSLGCCCVLLSKLQPDREDTASSIVDCALDLVQIVRSTKHAV